MSPATQVKKDGGGGGRKDGAKRGKGGLTGRGTPPPPQPDATKSMFKVGKYILLDTVGEGSFGKYVGVARGRRGVKHLAVCGGRVYAHCVSPLCHVYADLGLTNEPACVGVFLLFVCRLPLALRLSPAFFPVLFSQGEARHA